MENRLSREDFAISFQEEKEKEFYDLLDELSENDKWIDVDVSEIKISELPPMADSNVTTSLQIGMEGRNWPVFEHAVHSLRRRAENESKILDRLSPADTAEVLNKSWLYLKGNRAKALIRGESLLGLFSDRYVPFSQRRLYRKFSDYLAANFDDSHFMCASYSHFMTQCYYQIEDEELLDGYVAALRAEGFSVTEDIGLSVNLITSDCGKASVALYPCISYGRGENVQISPPLLISHRDGASFDDVDDGFDKLFSLVKESVGNLQRLLGIRLTFPSSVARRIAQDRKYALPKSLIAEIEPQLRMYENMGQPMSAHDFYFTIADVLCSAKYESLSARRKLSVKEALARLIFMSEREWASLDKSLAVW